MEGLRKVSLAKDIGSNTTLTRLVSSDHKMRKWWAQSYMGGVPLIVVGFRDDKGMVTYTDEISTASVTAGYNVSAVEKNFAFCTEFGMERVYDYATLTALGIFKDANAKITPFQTIRDFLKQGNSG